jgi:hypothetical protein
MLFLVMIARTTETVLIYRVTSSLSKGSIRRMKIRMGCAEACPVLEIIQSCEITLRSMRSLMVWSEFTNMIGVA